MPVSVFHSLTATTPDNTTAEIRPQAHWNAAHIASVSLAGSEVIKYIGAGGSSQSSGTVQFSNSNGVSFGMANGTITASIAALTSQTVQTQGIQSIAAGGNTVTAGGVVFSNSNGMSFGLNGSTVTGSFSTAAQTNQTLGLYASSQTTGAASSTTVDARSLTVVGAGGVSAGMSAGSLVISGASGGAADGINRLAAGTQTAGTNTTVNFANSNGVTFGMSGSNQITASHDGLRSHVVSAPNGSSSVSGVSFANSFGVSWSNSNGSIVASVAGGGGADTLTVYGTGNTAGDASSGTIAVSSLVFRGAGVASVGYSNDGAVVVSVPAGGGGGDGANILAAGTQTATSLGSVLFENSNGITFGMSGSTRITASHNGLTTAALSNHSHGNPTLALTNLSGTTASASNGLTLSLSAAAPSTAVSLYAVSNTTQSSSGTAGLSNLSFAGAGAVSVGVTGGTVVVSAAAGAQSAQTVGIYASSQTTGQSSSSTVDARSVTYRGAGIVSVGLSAGEVIISATGGAGGGPALSAAGSSQNAGTIVFSNSNGVSFGMNGSTITASHNGLTTAAASNHSHGFSAQGGSSAFQTLSFSNTNGVSFSNSNGQVVASVATTYAASNHSHGNPTLALTNLSGTTASASNGLTLSLSAAAPGDATLTITAVGNTTVNSTGTWANALSARAYGILSIGTSNGSLLFSTPDAVDFTQLSVGVSTGGNTAGDTGMFTGRVVLAGGANVTLSGSSNGNSATFSVIAGGGGAAISAAGSSQSAGTIVFSNSNGVSFGMNGSTVTASHNGLTTAALSNHSHGNPTLALTNLSGTTASASNGLTLSLSAAAQTAQTVGLYGVGNTTQNSSTTLDARTISYNAIGAMSVGFSNGSVQLSVPATSSLSATGQVSISSNGSTISIGVPNPSTDTNGYNPYADQQLQINQIGQASLIFDPQIFGNIAFDRIGIPIHNSNSSNSSGSHTLSFWFGLYSRNVSTLSLVFSASASTALTHSGTQGSYSHFSGLRVLTVGATQTVTAGKYWMAFASRTTSGGANGSYSNLMVNNGFFATSGTTGSYSYAGLFGQPSNATNQMTLGQGFYSATTSGVPSSVAFSQIQGTAQGAGNMQAVLFASSTV